MKHLVKFLSFLIWAYYRYAGVVHSGCLALLYVVCFFFTITVIIIIIIIIIPAAAVAGCLLFRP